MLFCCTYLIVANHAYILFELQLGTYRVHTLSNKFTTTTKKKQDSSYIFILDTQLVGITMYYKFEHIFREMN